MARLYRPHIPTEVKLKVVLRQIGEIFPDQVPAEAKRHRMMGRQLAGLLKMLAETLNCEVSDLRLDHDPALGAREKVPVKRPRKDHRWFNSFGVAIRYEPDANNPEHLFYRPHGAQFAGSHDVKTRIRGDHGQYSDIQLIKRERRRQKKAAGQPTSKPGFKLRKQKLKSAVRKKYRWPKRKFNQRQK